MYKWAYSRHVHTESVTWLWPSQPFNFNGRNHATWQNSCHSGWGFVRLYSARLDPPINSRDLNRSFGWNGRTRWCHVLCWLLKFDQPSDLDLMDLRSSYIKLVMNRKTLDHEWISVWLGPHFALLSLHLFFPQSLINSL